MNLKKRYGFQEFCDELDSANMTNTGDYHIDGSTELCFESLEACRNENKVFI